MKTRYFFRYAATFAALACLLVFAACSTQVPTVGVVLPQPSHLNNDSPPVQSENSQPPASTSLPAHVPETTLLTTVGEVSLTQEPVYSTEETTKEQTTAQAVKLPAPSGESEIATFYNDATKLVNSKKAGFRKSNTTTVDSIVGLEKVESIPLLGKTLSKEIRKKITEFLGEGTTVNTATKGISSNYLVSASLQGSDLTSASCQESGENYVVTLSIKSVVNPTRSSNNAIGRFTADFRTDSEARATLEEGLMGVKPTVGSVTITSKNAKITATINKYTGQAVKIRLQYAFDVEILDAAAAGVTIEKASGSGSSDITFSDFKF